MAGANRGRQALAIQGLVTPNRNGACRRHFIACVDGLKGFPEAIEAVIPRRPCSFVWCTWCGSRLNYVFPEGAGQEVAADLKRIYQFSHG